MIQWKYSMDLRIELFGFTLLSTDSASLPPTKWRFGYPITFRKIGLLSPSYNPNASGRAQDREQYAGTSIRRITGSYTGYFQDTL